MNENQWGLLEAFAIGLYMGAWIACWAIKWLAERKLRQLQAEQAEQLRKWHDRED